MTGANIKVCHVIHGLGPGGAEHVLSGLASVASDAGIDLSVVTLTTVPGAVYGARLSRLGVPVDCLDMAAPWDMKVFRRALPVVRRLAPDVVHTHMKHADVLGAHVSRHLGIPMASTLHMLEDEGDCSHRMKGWVAAQVRTRYASLTIAVSDAVRRWYVEQFRVDASRVVTVRNGVAPAPVLDQGARQRLRDELGVPPGSVMATQVGLMRPGKGFRQLLRAATLIPPSVDVRFVLVGDGPLRRELEATALATGLSPGRVTFTGYRADAVRLLSASDIVVQPSLYDALPTSLIEGLASGLPAVASDVDGLSEIVSPETGVLVAPGRPDDLAEAIMSLALDGERRKQLGAAARRRFETEFHVRIWADRLRAVYDAVRDGGCRDHVVLSPRGTSGRALRARAG